VVIVTAVAAVLFPRLNAVLHEGQAFWQMGLGLDRPQPYRRHRAPHSGGLGARRPRLLDQRSDRLRQSRRNPRSRGPPSLAQRRKAKRALAAAIIGLLTVAGGAVIWLAGV
jgi:hypothetical protein